MSYERVSFPLTPYVFEVNMARILIILNNTEFPANMKFLK